MTQAPPRRIALVASSFAPHIGGVEQHTAEVACELYRRGHAVEVWTVDRGERLGTVERGPLTVRYLPTPLPSASVAGVSSWLGSFPRAWRAWRSAQKAFAPDVLHIQCFGPNGIYGDLIGRVTRTPRIVSSHGETQADDHNVFERSALLRTSLRAAASRGAVTGCSQSVVDDLTARFGAHGAMVVPNGVDLDDVPDLKRVERDIRRIVGVGRLEHNKGFDLLLDAVALLPRDVSVELVGDGGQADALREQAERLGLGGRFSITGKVDHGAALRRIAGAGAVCVPSRKESFGIVVLEAWAVGTPVVATSIAGPADFVLDGDDGILVDPRDSRALSAALAAALEPHRAAQLSRRGSVRVQEFSWTRTAEMYESLYADMLD